MNATSSTTKTLQAALTEWAREAGYTLTDVSASIGPPVERPDGTHAEHIAVMVSAKRITRPSPADPGR